MNLKVKNKIEKKVENRIKETMSSVFTTPVNEIGLDASFNNINNWDSLKHMSLIIALEDEFEIKFNDDEIVDMVDFKIIMNSILSKITI